MSAKKTRSVMASSNDALDSMWETYFAGVLEVAEKAFQDVVVPYCRKRKLDFQGVNADWALYRPGDIPFHEKLRSFEALQNSKQPEDLALFELLNMPIPGSPQNSLGTLMPCFDYLADAEGQS